jgi:hypothetical protein
VKEEKRKIISTMTRSGKKERGRKEKTSRESGQQYRTYFLDATYTIRTIPFIIAFGKEENDTICKTVGVSENMRNYQ